MYKEKLIKDLKKERKDIEDEIKSLEARLEEIDNRLDELEDNTWNYGVESETTHVRDVIPSQYL